MTFVLLVISHFQKKNIKPSKWLNIGNLSNLIQIDEALVVTL